MSTYKQYCYVLVNDRDHKTYNGYTNNPLRRIRQHNAEIKGGAGYTTRHRKKDGRTWEFLFILESPGMTQKRALSLEWHLKYPTCRKPRPRVYNGANGRLASLPVALSHRKFSGMSVTVRVLDRYYVRAQRVLGSEESQQLLRKNSCSLRVELLNDVDEDQLAPSRDDILSAAVASASAPVVINEEESDDECEEEEEDVDVDVDEKGGKDDDNNDADANNQENDDYDGSDDKNDTNDENDKNDENGKAAAVAVRVKLRVDVCGDDNDNGDDSRIGGDRHDVRVRLDLS